ncbi:MAG: VWA domain-containing protein [Thermodesulfobacteriota bacterium]|nr:VWA domain-containing protein [Thermodesulfobacteriota bacterium]
MSAARRREISSFNLSFLDIMFCGFGAVVLLVLLINSNTVSSRREIHEDLRAEVMRLERKVEAGREHLVEVKNSLEQTDEEVVTTRGRAERVLARVRELSEELANLKNRTLVRKEHVNKLQSDLKTLDTTHRRMGAEIKADQDRGRQVRRFEGDGNRQYLTGLKLGGKRILLLVDTSASMLDSSVVNVIRRRNMDDASKRLAPKWQQVRQTVSWLAANVPPSSSLRIISFATRPKSLAEGASTGWIAAVDNTKVNGMIKRLNQIVPGGGTSLENVFAAAASLSPRPDNIVLLTDGLPTQGKDRPRRTTVSGEQRVKLFERAIKKLPRNVPVNTILFPMEGDPLAAALFWKLAVDTRGSFFTPTSDWP